MAGNVRFESGSVSTEESVFAGSHPNGLRGNYTNAAFDRSGSFREGRESRGHGSGASTPRASASSDFVSLHPFLLLDPITMEDQKYPRSGELRRVLGISLGNATEDNSFGAAHSKPPPPVATEELKRFKLSVKDASLKARFRTKRLSESLVKLNKFCEALNIKKQHLKEISMSEKSGGSNFMKMGSQIHRNSSDLGTQRSEDRTRNIVLNKRVRSSVAELRADGRNSTPSRQSFVVGTDRDMLRDGGEGFDLPEEKVRRMPAGGEGWDRKMKRKRSVASVFPRSTDTDGEVKRIMHHKFNNEPSLQPYDAQGFSGGSCDGTNGINKLDGSSSPASSNLRSVKNAPEKVSLARHFVDGVNKERVVAKANNKLNIVEGHIVGPSSVTKGKASRAHRTGSVVAANSSPIFSRTSGAHDGWEQTSTINKVNSISGPNNCKRTMPAGTSSPPMAQWVGQRPQKISRTRRANVVSPVSNHDDVQMSSEGGNSSDFSIRLTPSGSLAKDVAIGNQLVRVKHESVASPTRLSESEESGAGVNHEGRPKEKESGGGVEERSQKQSAGHSVVLMKKAKIINKEDVSDSLGRQGRTGRGASSSRANNSPGREKLENLASVKPARSAKPITDKNRSKSGRPPLKKISDRKAFTRGKTNGGSPNFTGESDDDREELLAAANFACNASYLSCSSSFWKNVEPVFACVCSEDVSYLKQQLKSAEELHKSLFEISKHGNNTMEDVHQEDFQSQLISEQIEKSLSDHIWPKELTTVVLADQGLDNGASCKDLERRNRITPLYQRVLSALIVEDESEEFEENCGGKNISSQNSRDSFPDATSIPFDFEPRNKDRIDFDCDSILGFQTQKQSPVDSISCNGNATINMATCFHNQVYNDDFFQGDQGFMNLKTGMFPALSGNNDRRLVETNAFGISVLDCHYEQISLEMRLLMELQCIGLYPEPVPDLADGDDQAINQDIIELQRGLHQQIDKKKTLLDKVIKAVEKGKEVERGALEQVAMNRLVELSCKKLLATRGSYASKYGVPKVLKPVALAFMKRTLATCREFEDTGKSCFSEPALRDVILAPPIYGSFSRAELHDHCNYKSGGVANAAQASDDDFVKTGPLLNRGKKKELLLDDVGSNASFRSTPSLLAGTKGKRSDRERDILTKILGRDRKTKSKPKQKTAQLSTSGYGISNQFKTSSNQKRESSSRNSYGYSPQDSSKESRGTTDIADLQDLSLELGIASDIGSHQDLSNLFNFDEDGLPENDLMPMDGLEIPMDDLSELNMLL